MMGDLQMDMKLSPKLGKDQFLANANAAEGAIQDCDYWIAQLQMATAPVAKPDPDSPQQG